MKLRQGWLSAAWILLWLAACALYFGAGPRPILAQEKEPAPKGTDPGTRQYAAAVALQNRELYDLAVDEWKRFLTGFANDTRVARGRHYLGVCLLKTGKYDESLVEFKKVVTDFPKFEMLDQTVLYTGISQYNLGQGGKAEAYDAAVATFNELLQKHTSSKFIPQGLYYLGESHYARGRRAEAVAAYEKLVKDHAQHELIPDALYAMGVAQQDLEKHAEAEATFAAFQKGYAKHNLATEVGMRRGQALFAQAKVAEAEKFFEAAAAVADFNHADYALLQQASCLSTQKQYTKAATLYASLPTKFPKSTYLAAAYLEGGKCSYLANELPTARAALGKVLELGGPGVPEAGHWIARAHLKESKPADALAVVEKVIPAAADGPLAAQLALDKADAVYEIADRRKEAVALYAGVSTKWPKEPVAQQSLYMAGFTALGLDDYATAMGHADAFLKAWPDATLAPDVGFIAAESRLQLGKHADAEAAYTALIAKHAQHADVEQWKVRSGLSKHLQKKHQETAAFLTTALPTLKAPALIAEANYLIGASQNELKQYEPAVKSLQAALAADASWRQADETLLALAHAQRQLGKLEEARGVLQSAVSKFPNSRAMERAVYRQGEYAYAADDFKSASGFYQAVLTKWPKGELAPFSLHGLGWSQLSLGEHDAAIKTLSALIEQHASHKLAPRAYYARALARQQSQKFAPAIEDLDAYLKTNPTGVDRSDALYVRGLSLTGLEKVPEAAAAYETILKEDEAYTGSDKVRYELAWSYLTLKDEAKAAAMFAQLAEKQPDSPLAAESLYHVGEHRYRLGSDFIKANDAEKGKTEFKAAALSYHGAMQKAGKSELGEKAVHKLGWSQFRQDEFEKSQGTFAYQRAMWPQGALNGDAAFMQGEAFFKLAKWQEAITAYQAVAKPQGKDFAALALLHAAQAAGKLNKWDDSLKFLDSFTKSHAENDYLPEALYEQGWAKHNQKKYEEALALYTQVPAKTDREVAARACFMTGEVHFTNKNHQEAIKHFVRAAYSYGYPEWQAAALFEMARCLEVIGKTKQAVDSYKEVVSKHPKSDKAPLAQKRLQEIGG